MENVEECAEDVELIGARLRNVNAVPPARRAPKEVILHRRKTFAGLVNEIFMEEDDHEQERQLMREQEAQYIEQLQQQDRLLEDRSKKLEKLADNNTRLAEEVRVLQGELDETVREKESLHSKARRLKDHLNTAISEQQELYKKTEVQTKLALDEVEARDRAQKTELAEAVKSTEAMRARLMATVRSVQEETKRQVQQGKRCFQRRA